MSDKLTVFYSKQTGNIKELCSGKQNMSWFGEEQEAYSAVFDFLVIDNDPFIFENFQNMIVLDGNLKVEEKQVPEKYR